MLAARLFALHSDRSEAFLDNMVGHEDGIVAFHQELGNKLAMHAAAASPR